MGDVDMRILTENQRLAVENAALRQLLGDKIEENRYSEGKDIEMHSMVESARERGIASGKLEAAEARIELLDAENTRLRSSLDDSCTAIHDADNRIMQLEQENATLKSELLSAQGSLSRLSRELERFKQAVLERNTTVNISIDSDKIADAVERGITKAGWSSSTLGPGRG